MGKYNELKWGKVEAVFNKLGGMEGADRFLCGELVVSEPDKRWREDNGVIYLSVTSDGTTGPQWIERLEKKGVQMDLAKQVLNSPDFNPTSGITSEIAILKGMLFENNDRFTKKIRAEAKRRSLAKPNPEVACLIREAFSYEEIEAMDLWWIVVMHDSIKVAGGDPGLLSVRRRGRWLDAVYGGPDCRWDRGRGFAFVVSQVSPGT